MIQVTVLDSLCKLCRRAAPPHDYFILESYSSGAFSPFDVERRFATCPAVQLQAARGESLSFQVLLRTTAERTESVRITVGTLESDEGGIAAANLDWHPVGMVKCMPFNRYPAITERGLKDYAADPLLPACEPTLHPGELLPIWVTVRTPRDTAGGLYTGSLRIESGAGQRLHVEMRLSVREFALPENCPLVVCPTGNLVEAMKSLGRDSEDPVQIADYCGAHARMLRRYYIHGTMFRNHWIRGHRREDGEWEMDFSRFDAALEALRAGGVTALAVFLGYEGDDKAFAPCVQGMDWPEFYRVYAEHLRRWGVLPDQGWSEDFIFMIGPDEPGINQDAVRDGLVEPGLTSDNPVLREALQHQAWAEQVGLSPHGGCLATLFDPEDVRFNWNLLQGSYQLMKFNDFRDLKTPFAERQRHLGTSLWWYTCCWPQSPNFLLTNSLSEARLIPWIAWMIGVRGITFYGYDLWSRQKPVWSFLYPSAESGNFGDEYKIYPHPDKDPAAPLLGSMRMEAYRDGLGDYTYLWLLRERCNAAEQAGDTAAAAHGRGILRECVETIMVYGEKYEWEQGHLLQEGRTLPTADTFRKVREELATAIESLARFG